MDPYEVLGVRRQASRAEIDLAFKCRRSQYHPDRYPDAEAAQWATERAKQVNAAYEALISTVAGSDGDLRSASQTQPSDTAPAAEPAKPTPAQRARVSLAQVLDRELPNRLGLNRIYVAPHIPSAKVMPALYSYGVGTALKDVLLVMDTTMMGGAKDGLMLTEWGILYKELLNAPQQIAWEQVQSIEPRGTKLYVNGQRILECAMSDAESLVRVFKAVAMFVSQFQAPASGASGGDRAAPASPAAERHGSQGSNSALPEIFHAAKQRLTRLANAVQRYEVDGRVIIDRHEAVAHFERLAGALADQEYRGAAEEELEQIAWLCHAVLSFTGEAPTLQAQARMVEGHEDSPLLRRLKEMLRHLHETMARANQEEAQQAHARQRQADVDAFFGR